MDEKEIRFFFGDEGIRGINQQHVSDCPTIIASASTENERAFPAADQIRTKIRPTLNL